MNCSDPIDAAVLAGYWVAALAGPEEETVELHLLDCDQCGARLREVIALAEGVRKLAREGFLRMVVSDRLLSVPRRKACVSVNTPLLREAPSSVL